VHAPSGVTVSATDTFERAPKIDWNNESMPFYGDARAQFDDLAPDYLSRLLENAPVPEEDR